MCASRQGARKLVSGDPPGLKKPRAIRRRFPIHAMFGVEIIKNPLGLSTHSMLCSARSGLKRCSKTSKHSTKSNLLEANDSE